MKEKTLTVSEPGVRGGARKGAGRPRKIEGAVNAGLYWGERHQQLWLTTAHKLGIGRREVLEQALEQFAAKHKVKVEDE